MKTTPILLLFFLAFCFEPAWAQISMGKDSGVIVNADQMSADFKTKTTYLRGNVQFVFRGQHLSCDRAMIDYKNQRIEAEGHVRLQSENAYAEATRLTLNYNNDTANLDDGFIQSGQVVFEGKQIRKTGPNTFVATEAKYTACASCPAAWSFSGQQIEAELGGYARIKRPILRVGGVPVVILPGILVPLKSARQSGILVPSLDYSRTGGLAFSESFFWAINPSQDLTVTAKYYELRGIKALSEYRYVLSDLSRGQMQGAYMQDRAVNREFGLSQDIDRWFFNYQHYYQLPENFVQRTWVKQVSDLRYLRDFPDEILGHGDPALENRISLTKNFAGQHLSIEASHHVNLLKAYPLAPNNDAVHRFPEIRYSVSEKSILGSPILFRMDANYNNFTRAEFSYDDMSATGVFADPPGAPCFGLIFCSTVGDKGEIRRDGEFDVSTGGGRRDLIRTGQRLDIRPTIAMPFRIFKTIDVIPQVAFRETQYRFQMQEVASEDNYSQTAAQRYVETEMVLRTNFSHVYGQMTEQQSQRIKHEVEPEITFSTIPWMRRSDHAFFGEFAGQRYSRTHTPISDADIYGKNGVQFDYNDRVFDRRLVELAITNRIIRKIWREGFPDYDRIMNFRISQSYDFNEATTDKPQPWSPINGILNMRLKNFETYTDMSYNPYAKITDTSARIRLLNDRGNYLQASYERIYLVNEDNVVTSRNQTENIGGGLGYKSRFFDLGGQIDYSAVSDKILSWQYVVDLKPPGNCWTVRFGHRQVIGGEPELRFNMSFDFGGEQVKKIN
ncbi:MAG: LPS-assembly protein LptD [Bdellovibrionales bacterium]